LDSLEVAPVGDLVQKRRKSLEVGPQTRAIEAFERIDQQGADVVLVTEREGMLGFLEKPALARLVELGSDPWSLDARAIMDTNMVRVGPNTCVNLILYNMLSLDASLASVELDNRCLGYIRRQALEEFLGRVGDAGVAGYPRQPWELDLLDELVDSGIVIADENLQILYANRSLRTILEECSMPRIGGNLMEFLDQAMGGHECRPWLGGTGGQDMVRVFEYRCGDRILACKIKRFCGVNGINGVDGVDGFAVVLRDITAERHELESIKDSTFRDPLTGLANRTLFMERLDNEIKRAERYGGKLIILFMDIDGFKAINDTYGHLVGDRVLEELAGRMSEAVRESDTVARLGGDEFVYLLPDLSDDASFHDFMHKIEERTRQRLDIDGVGFEVSVSMGYAIYPCDGKAKDVLLTAADRRMYENKKRRAQHGNPALRPGQA
jgi:diguanylate cyclase (GGDEF)-like protein